MKIALCGDVHFSQYSSIVRKRGTNYSMRLENLINSINWFQRVSKEHSCAYNFYLGDFFDKAELNAEEMSALSEIAWENTPQIFLCGNHEMGRSDHAFSSAKLFNLIPNAAVIDRPTVFNFDTLEICMVPYILEVNRKPLSEYLPMRADGIKRLILSHNDISGIQLGAFVSEFGFSISDIEANCDLYINGHLHNGTAITPKIINIGNCTGQNFSENALIYSHNIIILDTDTLEMTYYENPYAFNFYKLNPSDAIDKLKSNAVVSIKCESDKLETLRTLLETNTNIIDYHIVAEQTGEVVHDHQSKTADLSINHLAAFKDFILATFENTKELKEELNEVLK